MKSVAQIMRDLSNKLTYIGNIKMYDTLFEKFLSFYTIYTLNERYDKNIIYFYFDSVSKSLLIATLRIF